MESHLKLPLTDGTSAKILQITDTHLFGGVGESLLNVNTYQSYHAVLNAIKQQSRDYDLIVATGDLAQDRSLNAYQHFAQGISQFSAPCVWLPGNHDFQPAMVDALAATNVLTFKQVLLGKYWQLILLDTQVLGAPHGELSDYQLEWLAQRLSLHPDRHTLVLLHHHPVPAGCAWLDQHSLRNAYQLDDVLQNFPQAKTLLCGHIHQELDVVWNGRRVLATPSTCIQFKPHRNNFRLDTLAPGWREMQLHVDGSITTEVYRLTTDEFSPDMNSEGYE